MLDDRERELLLEIERRLQLEDPALVRFFDGVQHGSRVDHTHRVDVLAALAGLSLWTVLLLGPIPVTRSGGDVFGDEAMATRNPTEIRTAAAGAPEGRHGPAFPAAAQGLLRIPIETHQKGDPE